MVDITRYGPATHVFVVNARQITDWSAEDEPWQLETLEDLRDIEIQHGGGTLLIERVAEGVLVTVSLKPGSKDSAWFAGMYASGDLLDAQQITIGTGEKITLSGGVVTKFGDVGRAFKPSYDNYQMKFSRMVAVMGNK